MDERLDPFISAFCPRTPARELEPLLALGE